jgi:alpha-tubulin suppressor-like RCC1 family protein
VTEAGVVFSWRDNGVEHELQLVVLDGFRAVRVHRLGAGTRGEFFAIGASGELFSWGRGGRGDLGHGDRRDQSSPKRVEALTGVRVCSASFAVNHAVALTEDGVVYACGMTTTEAHLENPSVQINLLPKPVEALMGVRVSSIAAAEFRSYAVTDTGKLWAWGIDCECTAPLGHGEHSDCLLPKPIESMRGVKVDFVAVGEDHTLALADDGSVYAWGGKRAAGSGALGLGPSVGHTNASVHTPQRVQALRAQPVRWAFGPRAATA